MTHGGATDILYLAFDAIAAVFLSFVQLISSNHKTRLNTGSSSSSNRSDAHSCRILTYLGLFASGALNCEIPPHLWLVE